jgi:uncharacterized protein (TIRG00374 family)
MVDKIKRKRWKIFFTIITFAALALTAYLLRGQIIETVGNLRKANPWPVLLVVPLAVFNHFSQAKLYQGIFRILGDRFRTRAMMRLSLELNFVNNVFPSAGVSGFSYLSIRMKPEGISAGKATLVQIMRFALLFVSFQLLLGLGLLLLAFVGSVNNFVMLVAGSLATLLLVGTLIVVYIISSKSRINAFFTSLTRLVNRLIQVVRPRHPETISVRRVERVFTELHENYKLLRTHVLDLRRPLGFALTANIAEITAIFFVFAAFGHIVNPGAIIIAYAVANFAGIVSVLPGGIGIYEALMTGVFAAAGITPGLSLPVIVAFRMVSMATQMPVGYFFYQRSLQNHDTDQDQLE